MSWSNSQPGGLVFVSSGGINPDKFGLFRFPDFQSVGLRSVPVKLLDIAQGQAPSTGIAESAVICHLGRMILWFLLLFLNVKASGHA